MKMRLLAASATTEKPPSPTRERPTGATTLAVRLILLVSNQITRDDSELKNKTRTIQSQFDSMSTEELNNLYPVEPDDTEAAKIIQDTIDLGLECEYDAILEEEVYASDELNIDPVNELEHELRSMGKSSPHRFHTTELIDDDEAFSRTIHGVGSDKNWYPYPSATACYLDLLDNIPRLRFSDAQLKMVLWLLKKTGVQLNERCGVRVGEYKSDLGNIFSSLSLEDLASRDFSNPMVAPHIVLYPEDVGEGPISEMWQVPGGRWTEFPQDMLPPSILNGTRRFYIHEIAELEDGAWVIPQLWFTAAGQVYAKSYPVQRHLQGSQTVVSVGHESIWVLVASLKLIHEELVTRHSICFDGKAMFSLFHPSMHSLDVRAESGWVYQTSLPTTLSNPRKHRILDTMASQNVTTASQEEMDTSVNRFGATPTFTRQIQLASYGNKDALEKLQTATAVKDKISMHWIEILLQEYDKKADEDPERPPQEISEELLQWLGTQTSRPYNPLLDVPYVSQDTLVEILHTILLGVEKYGWQNLYCNWTDSAMAMFGIRLQGSNIRALTIPPIRAQYMIQYRKGLIGKHFKTLLQLSTFHIHGIVEESQFMLIRANRHVDEYLADLTILIDNVLDAFAEIESSRILSKIKLHMLVHLPAQIRRRGPAVRFSTEIDESFNAVFRLCSVLSNHQAASRDISKQLVGLDRMKHLMTGGYWQNEDGQWVSAGSDVKSILKSSPIIQTHLGWAPPPSWTPGLMRAAPTLKNSAGKRTRERHSFLFSETGLLGCRNSPYFSTITPDSAWVAGTKVSANSGDTCEVGSWVVCSYQVKDHAGHESVESALGQVTAMFLPETFGSSGEGFVKIKEYRMAASLHFKLRMPVLHEVEGSGGLMIPSKRQERQMSTATVKVMTHKYTGRNSFFVVNTHAIHNARLLRRFLPRNLTAPTHLFPHRLEHLNKIAETLVVTQAERQKEITNKANTTRARNKQKKAEAEKRSVLWHEAVS
ncbi:hypothetical protein AAF712_015156 [Marasmius tenuissimus]|uniref:Uncharacterized protein n=1 Tax=Marasmius tenuissimus TaxID=585030 RepID=A0ABR2ZB13_9AGAR